MVCKFIIDWFFNRQKPPPASASAPSTPPVSPSQVLIEKVYDDVIYVILPYFNYCGFRRRRDLFLEFVARMRTNKYVRMVVVEVSEYGSTVANLPSLAGVYKHFRFFTKDCIWLKENLINLGVSKLPNSWKYMAWVDADLTFENEMWAQDTMDRLDRYDIVQLFDRCDYLGPDGEVCKTDRSFGYQYRESGKEHRRDHKYGFWHPGMAWACRRAAFDRMGGLIDWGILGSGDHHMSLAWIGKVHSSYPNGIHPNYIAALSAFQDRCAGLTLSYVHGTILHHWHGSLKDRRYVERWNILVKGAYDPKVDIVKNNVGLIQLTATGRKLVQPIREYFLGRREDNMINEDVPLVAKNDVRAITSRAIL